MAWVAPRTWAATDLVTAAMLNADVRDNPLALRAGGLALASQAANDILYATSTTQLGRIATGTGYLYTASGAAPIYTTSGGGLTTAIPAGAITTGSLAIARLTGYPSDATKALLGDGTWGSLGPKAIYRGTISIPDSATSGTAAISAVVLANTMIMNLGATGVTAGYDFNQAMVRLELTSTVLVTAYRGSTATGALTVGYCVVEWN